MPAIRGILHPTDFSESSRPAFELACLLARDYAAELLLLHVIPPVLVAAPDGALIAQPEDPDRVRQRLEEIRPPDPRVTAGLRLAEGNPVEEIVRAAREVGADLVVMGTHGRGGLSRLLMGSTADGVMRTAPCPVLTVKAPAVGDTGPEPEAATAGRPAGRWND